MADLAPSGLDLTRDGAPTVVRVGDVLSAASRLFAARGLGFRAMMAPGAALFAAATWPPDLVVQVGDLSQMEASPPRLDIPTWPAILALALALVCSALAAAAVAFGAALGLVLIAPGRLALSLAAVAIPACVVEQLGPIRSLARSAFLTAGNRWRVFGLLVLLYGGGGVVDALVAEATIRLAGERAATVVSAPFRIAVGVFTAVTIAVLYARLRGAREGVDVDEVGRVFD